MNKGQTRRTGARRLAAGMLVACAAAPASAGITYWDFNVFSRSSIGSESGRFAGNTQGAGGAVGDVWLQNVNARSLAQASPGLPAAYYAGGSFGLHSGSISSGGLEVAGSITLTSFSVTGPVRSGANMNGGSGSIQGDVSLGGTNNTTVNSVTFNGSLSQMTGFQPTVDLLAASAYFDTFADAAWAMQPTTTHTSAWGLITINASGPLTVVNLSAAELQSAWGVEVKGSGPVVVNVSGSSATLASTNWTYSNGATAASTLLNFGNASALTINGSQNVSILAADAAVAMNNATTGSLYVGSLSGSGQINWNGSFTGALVIPSPATAGILGGLGVVMMTRRRR